VSRLSPCPEYICQREGIGFQVSLLFPSQFLVKCLEKDGEHSDGNGDSTGTNKDTGGSTFLVITARGVFGSVAAAARIGGGGRGSAGFRRSTGILIVGGELRGIESAAFGLDIGFALGELNGVASAPLGALLESLLADEGVKRGGVVLEAGFGSVVTSARVIEGVLRSESSRLASGGETKNPTERSEGGGTSYEAGRKLTISHLFSLAAPGQRASQVFRSPIHQAPISTC